MAVADAQLYRGAEKCCSACPKAAGLPLLNLQSSSIHTSVEGGPGKKHRTNKRPPTGRIQEKTKGERKLQSMCPTNLPGFFWLEAILAEWMQASPGRIPDSEGLARDNPGTNPITIKPKTVSHMAEPFSWFP